MKHIRKFTIVAIIASVLGLGYVLGRPNHSPVMQDQAESPETAPACDSVKPTLQEPVLIKPQQPGQATREFTVKVARYVSNGTKILAKSELSVRAGVGYIEPEGTVTAWIPAALWEPYQTKRIALVGKKVRITGTLGMIKVDGQEPNEITATALELVK